MKVRNVRLRQGHAPGHVRGAFDNAVEELMSWRSGDPEPTVEFEVNYEPHMIPISRACTLVWNCTDVAPGHLVDMLRGEIEFSSRTYAALARAIHADIQARLTR
jgi:hypothetical protein